MSGNVGSRGEGAGSVNSEVKRFVVGGAEPYREQTTIQANTFTLSLGEDTSSDQRREEGGGLSAALFINQF